MSEFWFIFRQVAQGRSVARSYFNLEIGKVKVSGKVIDIGAGTSPYYHDYVKKAEGTTFHSVDRKMGDTTNFETDKLPFPNDSFDTVLSMNVLEHIYNHKFHFSELVRLIKPEGKLVLFVPFLYMYHADHDKELLDCYRYTSDTLLKLSEENSLSQIKITPVSRAAFTAALNMINLSLPRLIRVPLFCIVYAIDGVILRIRPKHRELFPLGYILEAYKITDLEKTTQTKND